MGKKKQDQEIPPVLLTLSRQDIDKCLFKNHTVTDEILDRPENGSFKVGNTYPCLKSIKVNGVGHEMKTMNYNNLRKVARKFIGSAATKMSKQAILLAIGRLSAGDMTGIITTTTIDNAEILNHATTLRIINVAFADQFVPDLLEWYSTSNRKWKRGAERTIVSPHQEGLLWRRGRRGPD